MTDRQPQRRGRSQVRTARGRRVGLGLAVPMLMGIVVVPPSVGAGENWPNWLGPARTGVSTETNLPTEWDTETNVAWKVAMPAWSGSTPIIWGERVFLNVADGDNISLTCPDRNTGETLWTRHLSGGDHRERKQNMSSPSPVTNGEQVYVMTGTGVLTAFDVDGNQLWARDIQASEGPFGLKWGYASSPLLVDEALFVQVLHGMRTDDPSYVLRIDRHTGETVWHVERQTSARRESPDSYTTPALLEHGSTREIVITGGDVVTGHDTKTGQELWRADGLNPQDNGAYRIVALPIVHGEMIYAPTRVRPLLALRAGGRGDVTTSHLVWKTDNGPDVPTPVNDGTFFYVVNDRGIVWVLDAQTGEEIYGRQRLRPGTYSASPVLADGKIYITNESGLTSVFTAGRSSSCSPRTTWTTTCSARSRSPTGRSFCARLPISTRSGNEPAPAAEQRTPHGSQWERQ